MSSQHHEVTQELLPQGPFPTIEFCLISINQMRLHHSDPALRSLIYSQNKDIITAFPTHTFPKPPMDGRRNPHFWFPREDHLICWGKGEGMGPPLWWWGHMGIMGGTVSTWAELGAQHSLIVSRHKMK